MKWLKSGARRYRSVGLQIGTGGLAFAVLERAAGQLPRLLHAEYLAEAEQPARRLRERLAALNCQSLPCRALLSAGCYQFLLTDAPNVPEAELGDALRWRIKDLINIPVNEAVIDAFLLPESCTRAGNRLAYAAVARRSQVAELVTQVEAAGLQLLTIEVPELALGRLVETVADTSRAVALVHMVADAGYLVLVRDDQLYLARHFQLPYHGGLLDDIPADALALEVQRSLDYFERQMRQTPPAQIWLAGENISADKITDGLRQSLSASIDLLALTGAVEVAEAVPEHTLSLCLPALGAALNEARGH